MMKQGVLLSALCALGLLAACSSSQTLKKQSPPLAAGTSPWIAIPAGSFIQGSDAAERELAYRLDETLAQTTRPRQIGLYDAELPRHEAATRAYRIDKRLVTQADYQRFVAATGAAAPDVTEAEWNSYGLIYGYQAIQHFRWQHGQPPAGYTDHPVVLVTHRQAMQYCDWIKTQDGNQAAVGRLPTEKEWEKSARGTAGRIWPWGNDYDPDKLNDAQHGPMDTQPVGLYPQGNSPYGMEDAAGMAFEWTASSKGCADPSQQSVVKGGAWDDTPGVTRAAARHCRPNHLKHVLVSFRCVLQ